MGICHSSTRLVSHIDDNESHHHPAPSQTVDTAVDRHMAHVINPVIENKEEKAPPPQLLSVTVSHPEDDGSRMYYKSKGSTSKGGVDSMELSELSGLGALGPILMSHSNTVTPRTQPEARKKSSSLALFGSSRKTKKASKQQQRKQSRKMVQSRGGKKQAKGGGGGNGGGAVAGSKASRNNRKRKTSLQNQINLLTFAQDKIEKYKAENALLKEVNAELNEINGELKEYIDDKNEVIQQRDHDINELQDRLTELERELTDCKNGNSINDILYKVQGDSVSKLKFGKMSAKRVIFINGINHLFYYDETESAHAPAAEAKCIVVRDVLLKNHTIESTLKDKPWFLVVGTRRKALFIADSMGTRDKWLSLMLRSLNLAAASSSMMTLDHTVTATATHTGSEPLQHMLFLPNQPNIVTSPRSGNTKVMLQDAFEYKQLVINYPAKISNCTVANNGHTVHVHIGNLNKCTLSIHDGSVYRLQSFHFHVPAEHAIHDRQHEVELNLVHVNPQRPDDICVLCFMFTPKQKYKSPKLVLNESKTHLMRVPEATKASTPVPVTPQSTKEKFTASFRNLAVHAHKRKDEREDTASATIQAPETDDDESEVEEWNECDDTRNDFLHQFWHQLPPQKTKEDVPLNKALNFDFLFKTASNNFIKDIKTNEININVPIYDYMGALRTPPYTKNVQFLVSKHTHFISFKQLNILKKIWYHYL